MRLQLFLLILFLPLAAANQLHMPLLAVQDDEGKMKGSVAELYVSKEYGPGRVFIDTLPLTKADTQMSTRLARQIACNYVDADCSRYDFFYVIRADSSIIGGPSASAAMAVLTVAAIEGLDVKPGVSITGTISSGNVIGPVGGVKEKIEAAGKNGLSTVLIPKGEAILNFDNQTINLRDYGAERGVQVIEVATLGEAVFYITGADMREKDVSFAISQSYTDTMRELAEGLCERRDSLKGRNFNSSMLGNYTKDLDDQSAAALDNYQYYAAASYCFGSNVAYSTAIYQEMNRSQLQEERKGIKDELDLLEEEIDNISLDSITDLQTYMVVRERLREAYDALPNVSNATVPAGDLAYAKERLHSIYSWKQFFDSDGKHYEINQDTLKKSCLVKLSEAEETYQYLSLYVPGLVEPIKEEYQRAFTDFREGNYELCLFKASKAKAQSNRLLGMMGVGEEGIKDIISLKLDVAQRVIAEQSEKGRFPIVGYSYYEYANSLQETDPYSALLYAEYALELSNLDFYLEQKNQYSLPFYINNIYGSLFFTGLFIGLTLGLLFAIRMRKNPTKHS
ncbi:MAG: S16 family serine protease [Candidatus Woesearchaeota archaeon]